MSYDKMLYEAQKHWRKKQKQQRQIEIEQAQRVVYEENKTEIELVKKAAFLAVELAKITIDARWLDVGDILCQVQSVDELEYYYNWCCGRLD